MDTSLELSDFWILLKLIFFEQDNVLELIKCEKHFDTPVPDAYSVYRPLATATVSALLGEYIFDLKAKLHLVRDYLNGLAFLSGQKGVMHRDIKPDNLAVMSLDQPKGIILDLDAATTERYSRDHTKGTVLYLAPEVIRLKKMISAKTSVPYTRAVDVWAMELSAFAIYSGKPFRWHYFEGLARPRSGSVTKPLHGEFCRRLLSDIARTTDNSERIMLEAIEVMTKYESRRRISAAGALKIVQDATGDEGDRGTIVERVASQRMRIDP